MRPGELRRFVGLPYAAARGDLDGQLFVLVQCDRESSGYVSFLVDGRLFEGYGYEFIRAHSEVVNEDR